MLTEWGPLLVWRGALRYGLPVRSAILLLVLSAVAGSAGAQDVWETPHAGVMHLHRTTTEPWEIHAVLADLCTPGMRVRASTHDERAQVTSAFAAEAGAAVAVNGDFFSWEAGYDTVGIAVGNGEPWPDNTPDDRWALAAFGLERAELFSPMTVLSAEPWMSEAVGGVPELEVGGVPIDDYPGWSFCSVRHPRTALGLSEDRRTLILVTVDGRSSASAGMTCPELAALMAELGAFDAINLDGGGSTAMVMDGSVVNRPSDGSERTVGNSLGLVLDGSTGVDACPGGGEPPPPGGFPMCPLDPIGPGETRTIDDRDACFSSMGPSYFDGPDHGYTFAVDCGAPGPRACDAADTSGRWLFHIGAPGAYRIEVRIPEASATGEPFSAQAPYRVQHQDGSEEVVVDQQAHAGGWRPLGTFDLSVQNNVVVSVHDNTGEPYVSGGPNRVVAFDQLRVVALPVDPVPGDGGPIDRDGGSTEPDLGATDDADGSDGCGCSSAPLSGALPWLFALLAIARRRR